MSLDRRVPTALLPALTIGLTACASGGRGDDAGWEAAYDTIGDTLVVRTVSGSVWQDTARLVPEVSIGVFDGPEEYIFGAVVSLARAEDGTIYVMDRQVPALRVYNPDGTYRTTYGREGAGPGEYRSPDGGLNILSDGRILLRDPRNARIQVFSPTGEDLDTWIIRGNFNTSSRMMVDTADVAYTILLLNPGVDVRDWEIGLLKVLPDGTPGDTLKEPDTGYDPPRIEARRVDGEDVSTNVSSVPFSPDEDATMSRFGYWIHGVSRDYSLTLLKPEGPLRIVKDYQPVPVTRGEKAEAEAFAIRNMRSLDPNWRWNGAPIPDHKPPYSNFLAGDDGSIWVQVSQPAIRRDDPSYDPSDPNSIADEWIEPVLFDVFDDEGRYLGAVKTPLGFNAGRPQPIFTTDWVLATVHDEYDVTTVVLFRVQLPDGRSPSGAAGDGIG